jgi:hypothetical protein
MNDEDIAGIQTKELVLASTLDAFDAPALCTTRARGRQLALQ